MQHGVNQNDQEEIQSEKPSKSEQVTDIEQYRLQYDSSVNHASYGVSDHSSPEKEASERSHQQMQNQQQNIMGNVDTQTMQQSNEFKHFIKLQQAQKDHQIHNQSTDCEDIVPHFKSAHNQPKKLANDIEQHLSSSSLLTIQSETQNQVQVSNSVVVKAQEKEEIKISTYSDQIKKEDINILSNNSQHLDEEVQVAILKTQNEAQYANAQLSQDSDISNQVHKNLSPSTSQEQPEKVEESKQLPFINVEKPKTQPSNQNYGSESGRTFEEVKNDQSVQSSSDSSETEEEDDEDEQPSSTTSIVVEVSPRGRFKRFGEELGRGAYKIVYKGVDNETGREIAWNVINLNRLPKQDRIRIKSEIDLIKKLQHKNIIHFISAWFNKEREQVVFITEMITGGSLRKYVKKIKNPRLKVIKGWCIEILQGLVYLHDQKPHPIIHRDLKCDNIFINSNSGEIRIGDLGLSTPMQNSFTTSVLGTPEFMAPELYEECYGTSVDIYAFGMCVLEMITLERPYKECQNPAQIYNKVVQGIRPKALDRIEDDEIKNFILSCLNRADKRPSAKELLESPFLHDIESEKNNHEIKVKPLIKDKKTKKRKSIIYLKKQHQSTILEEEEENSEENQSAGKIPQTQDQVDLIKANNHPQITTGKLEEPQDSIQLQSATTMGQTQIEDQSNINLLSQDKLQIMKSTDSDQQQHNGSSSSSMNKDLSKISDRKSKKGESKNKKLDQSVIFLQQIDEDKMKKLQERTMLQQQNDENNQDDQSQQSDQDKKDHNNQGDILTELKLQDQIEEQKLEKERIEKQQLENLHKTEKFEQQNLQQDKDKDYPHLALQSGEFPEKKKNQATFKKNFKEDHTPKMQPQNKQSQPAQFKTIISSSTDQLKHGSSDDFVIRQSSKEQSSLNSYYADAQKAINTPLNQVKQSTQILGHLQQSQEKKKEAQYHQQHSDNHLLNLPIQNIPKNSHGGSQIVDTQKDSVFDNQSSSSDNSNKDRDSEVDAIVMPKFSQDDHGVTKYTSSTPINETGQFFQGKAGSTLDVAKNTATTSKFQGNSSHSHNAFATSSSQVKNLPLQQNQMKYDDSKHQKMSNPKAHQQSQLHHQEGKQQQQQISQPLKYKPDAQILQSKVSSQQQQQPQHQKYQVQVILSPDTTIRRNNKINMSFKIKSNDGTPEKEVTFDFDIHKDTPQNVASEMVQELQLHNSYIEIISKQIQAVIEKTKQELQKQMQTKQQQQQPLQNQQQSSAQVPIKKSSPTKISRDTAVSFFNKLFEGIDSFFQIMQSKGIDTTDEIIDAMDGTMEEKQAKLDLLNQVFQAKRNFKKTMEQIKAKQQQKKSQSIIEPQPIKQQQQKFEKQNQEIPTTSQQKKPTNLVSGDSFKKVNSHQDIASLAQQHFEEPQVSHKSQQQQQMQKTIYQIPGYVRKAFKTAPIQFTCVSKLDKILRRSGDEPSTPDEEVMSLQNVLNLIFQVSIIQLQKKPLQSEETKQIIHNYVPLRIDGQFCNKTEAYVIKFQKHLQLHPDGIVNEQLWQTLLQYADQIVTEEKKAQQQQQQQQITLQVQHQHQQQQQQIIKPPHQQQQTTSAFITTPTPIVAQKSKQDLIVQLPLGSKQQQSQNQWSQISQQYSQQQLQSIGSPTKYGKKPQNGSNFNSQAQNQVTGHHDIDYEKVIQQAFTYESLDPDQSSNSDDNSQDQM